MVREVTSITLIDFQPMLHFYTPWKHQKIGGWKWVNYKQSKENDLPLVFNAFMYNHFHKMLYQSTVPDNA